MDLCRKWREHRGPGHPGSPSVLHCGRGRRRVTTTGEKDRPQPLHGGTATSWSSLDGEWTRATGPAEDLWAIWVVTGADGRVRVRRKLVTFFCRAGTVGYIRHPSNLPGVHHPPASANGQRPGVTYLGGVSDPPRRTWRRGVRSFCVANDCDRRWRGGDGQPVLALAEVDVHPPRGRGMAGGQPRSRPPELPVSGLRRRDAPADLPSRETSCRRVYYQPSSRGGVERRKQPHPSQAIRELLDGCGCFVARRLLAMTAENPNKNRPEPA